MSDKYWYNDFWGIYSYIPPNVQISYQPSELLQKIFFFKKKTCIRFYFNYSIKQILTWNISKNWGYTNTSDIDSHLWLPNASASTKFRSNAQQICLSRAKLQCNLFKKKLPTKMKSTKVGLYYVQLYRTIEVFTCMPSKFIMSSWISFRA